MSSGQKFRLDRALSMALGRPIAQMRNAAAGTRIPILMYHGVREGLGARHAYYETNISPQLFASHMRFLRDNGYTTIDLSEAVETIAAGRETQKQVVVTFDDGYGDFYDHGFPILAELGYKAMLFVVSGLTGDHRLRQEGNEYMSWDEVREVRAHGIEIGSHTVTHPELVSMTAAQVGHEIRQSKETIEQMLGQPIRSFSYPFAFPEGNQGFVEMLENDLQASGYQNGVSTIIGTASGDSNRFFLPRLPVNSYDDLALFEAKLEGGYDWLHTAQIAYKRLFKRAASSVSYPERTAELQERV